MRPNGNKSTSKGNDFVKQIFFKQYKQFWTHKLNSLEKYLTKIQNNKNDANKKSNP